MITKYVVYVTETNSYNSKNHITFDVEFDSKKKKKKSVCITTNSP